MPGCLWRRPRRLGVGLEHLYLTVGAAGDQPLVSRPAHALDQVLVCLCLPFFLSACKVPDFYNAVTAAAGKVLERIGVLCKRVHSIDVSRLEAAEEGLRKHALDLCRIESSGVFSRALKGVLVGVEVAGDLGNIGSGGLHRGGGAAERLDLHGGRRPCRCRSSSRRRELLGCAEISKRRGRGQPTSGGGASRVSVGAGRKN